MSSPAALTARAPAAAQLAGTRGVAHSYVAFARKHPDKIVPATVVILNAIAVESAILRD